MRRRLRRRMWWGTEAALFGDKPQVHNPLLEPLRRWRSQAVCKGFDIHQIREASASKKLSCREKGLGFVVGVEVHTILVFTLCLFTNYPCKISIDVPLHQKQSEEATRLRWHVPTSLPAWSTSSSSPCFCFSPAPNKATRFIQPVPSISLYLNLNWVLCCGLDSREGKKKSRCEIYSWMNQVTVGFSTHLPH